MSPEEHLEKYREDGFTVIRGAIPEEHIEGCIAVLAGRVDELARERFAKGAIEELFDGLPFPKRVDAVVGPEGVDFSSWYRYWNDILFTEPFYKLITSEPFIASVSRILGPEITFQGIGHIRPYL